MKLTRISDFLCHAHCDQSGYGRGRQMRPRSLVLLAVGCIAVYAVYASVVVSQPLTVTPVPATEDLDDGYVWLTVGDLNNPEFEGLGGGGRFAGRGRVAYPYRIAQTEVLTRQHLEFVEAYWPYYDGNPRSEHFTGIFIRGEQNGNGYVYEILSGWEDSPNTMSLRMAARFCNWLHNGKVNEQWAFDNGVYDTSTFTRNPDRTYNDDYTRSNDARYWIPTLDEWYKAVYYDPDRSGPGNGGWWDQPARSDDPLVIGYPMDDGETNASLWEWYNSDLPAGMYPDVQTPWGLLDASGGLPEHTADGYAFGSGFFDIPETVAWFDRAGNYYLATKRAPDLASVIGLRLAKPAARARMNVRRK